MTVNTSQGTPSSSFLKKAPRRVVMIILVLLALSRVAEKPESFEQVQQAVLSTATTLVAALPAGAADVDADSASDEDATNETPLQRAVKRAFFHDNDEKPWHIWDREQVLFAENHTCEWVPFMPAHVENMTSFPNMCVHPGGSDAFVTGFIKRDGRWKDCNSLTLLIREQEQKKKQGEELIYFDIGANIGSCVMQILFSSNATILAFEPDPHNLFCLTSTIHSLDKEYRDRVFVFPIGLGETPSASTIHTAIGNRGNAVIGQAIKDSGIRNQKFLEASPIQVDRMDDILGALQMSSFPIHVMKMDAQGYECHIVRGMKETLRNRVQILVFELEPHFLSKFDNCSGPILYNEVLESDLRHIYHYDNPEFPPRIGDAPEKPENLLAARQNRTA